MRRLRMLNEVPLNPDHQIFDSVPLKIMHMFFDTNDGVPVVLEDYGHLRDSCHSVHVLTQWKRTKFHIDNFLVKVQ
jgi:hypothetical protein